MTTNNLPDKAGASTPAPTDQAKCPATLRQLLEGELFREQVSKALPKHLTPERFVRVAVTAINKTPMLAQCDQASFFNALLTLSQLGLEPDGRRAHLIPFRNNKKSIVECQLIVDYKGLVELITNTGEVSNVHADVICENDVFEYDKGELKRHQIDFKKPRGAVYAAYALIRFKDGTEKVEVMTKDEVESIRKRSKAAESGPWVTDWNEMAKKTVFRRASKWVKLSPEQRDVVEADDDNVLLDHPKAVRDVGAELEKRLGLSAPPADVPKEELPAPENVSGAGLSGSRLMLWEKIAEACAGADSEMAPFISNLSAGRIKSRAELAAAADDLVKELIDKFTGGKK